jgi:hypothetical protein
MTKKKRKAKKIHYKFAKTVDGELFVSVQTVRFHLDEFRKAIHSASLKAMKRKKGKKLEALDRMTEGMMYVLYELDIDADRWVEDFTTGGKK